MTYFTVCVPLIFKFELKNSFSHFSVFNIKKIIKYFAFLNPQFDCKLIYLGFGIVYDSQKPGAKLC